MPIGIVPTQPRAAHNTGLVQGRNEVLEQAGDLLGPLYGTYSALEGIADSVDNLIQTIPHKADDVIAEMIRCAATRLGKAIGELSDMRDEAQVEGGAA